MHASSASALESSVTFGVFFFLTKLSVSDIAGGNFREKRPIHSIGHTRKNN
jgi:hypothetical protein